MHAALESVAEEGSPIVIERGIWRVPSKPIVLYVEGDGIGPEVIRSAIRVVDEAVSLCYGSSRRIVWVKVYAGHEADRLYGTRLPKQTVDMLLKYRVVLKGPLETPVGTGWRSVNVAIRQLLDLYANIRPIRYIRGVEAPIKSPERVDLVIFRENTDDLYVGIEWPWNSEEAKKVREFLEREFGIKLPDDCGIGVKPMSKFKTERIGRLALRYAIENKRRVVTVVHKGNIMKYTEGAFRDWIYELAMREFREHVVTEEEVQRAYGGVVPEGKVLLNDRMMDNMLQQIIRNPEQFSVIVCPNVNGDYLSEAAAALVGGVGLVGTANVGDWAAMFEPMHGTAPKYAGKNVANPTAAIMAACLMLDFMGWREASSLIRRSVEVAIAEGKVTQDIARYRGVKPLTTTEFTNELIETMRTLK